MALSFAEFLAQENVLKVRWKIAKPYQRKNGPKHFTPERTTKLCRVVNCIVHYMHSQLFSQAAYFLICSFFFFFFFFFQKSHFLIRRKQNLPSVLEEGR